LRVRRLDHQVLVRRVRAAAVAEAEVAGRQLQRRVREDVAGVRVRETLAREAQHRLAARVHPAVLGGDRGLADPLLKAQHALVVPLRDLGLDRFGRSCGVGEAWQRERGDRACGRAEESASGVGHGGRVYASPGAWICTLMTAAASAARSSAFAASASGKTSLTSSSTRTAPRATSAMASPKTSP